MYVCVCQSIYARYEAYIGVNIDCTMAVCVYVCVLNRVFVCPPSTMGPGANVRGRHLIQNSIAC